MKKTAFIIIALLLAFGCSDEKHEVPKEDNPLFSTSRAISLNQLGETIKLEFTTRQKSSKKTPYLSYWI